MVNELSLHCKCYWSNAGETQVPFVDILPEIADIFTGKNWNLTTTSLKRYKMFSFDTDTETMGAYFLILRQTWNS